MKKLASVLAKTKRRAKDMPPEQARAILDDMAIVRKHSDGCHVLMSKNITRVLSGGYWSQGLEFVAIRSLGERAGMIK
jgi:ppGpp synthetase/RelA/SpoT-type nucleotidyltranferase